MKTLTTSLILALFCSFALVGTQAIAQDTDDDNGDVQSVELEATILQLREQLMKLERSRDTEAEPASSEAESNSITGDVIAETPSLSVIRSGNGAFGSGSRTTDVVRTQRPIGSHTVAQYQPAIPYQQALPLPMTLPANSTWFEQPLPTQFVPGQSLPAVIASPAPQVYAAPAVEYVQSAPIVGQPSFVEQAPVAQSPQTIIVNIYQQAPPAQNNFFPSIMAPIYGPAPIQVSAPRRGCCLFGRR